MTRSEISFPQVLFETDLFFKKYLSTSHMPWYLLNIIINFMFICSLKMLFLKPVQVLINKTPVMPLTNFSIQFSCSVMSDSLRPHEPEHARSPCPSPTPRVHPNPCPLSRWCHPTISSSVIPFSSCPQSFPANFSISESWNMVHKFSIWEIHGQNV